MPEPCATPLRYGWTTGACAAAAACAAARALITGSFPDPVTVQLPRGRTPAFALAHRRLEGDEAEAGVIKDAGDDPDVTHGALVIARVRRLAVGRGVVFCAGPGVGTVTRPGLPLPPGEPAINPGPRAMIVANLGLTDAEVTISIPDGAALAERTLNGRLGILGGLSILGTTGVVVPYSCSAWIDAIHRAIDVARACGVNHLAAVTGKTSEHGVRALHPMLDDVAIIDAGDFIGGFLQQVHRRPVPLITLAGGFAKFTKLAAGCLDLHSKRSEVDFAWLAGVVAAIGGSPAHVAATAAAATALAALDLSHAAGLPLADAIASRARTTALAVTGPGIAVEVAVFDRHARLVGRTPAV